MPPVVNTLGNGFVGVVPVPAIVLLVVAIAAWWLTRNTRWGRWIYATGGNSEAAKRVGIPVGKVLASGYCRALEMGRLAFGRVEASDALLLRTYVPLAGAPAPPAWSPRIAMLKTLLATPPEILLAASPPAPTNTILITHFPNIKAALGLDIDFGGAVIVRPSGTGDTRLVARISGEEWGSLAPGKSADDKD